MTSSDAVLLVEDNEGDEALTLRAFKKHDIPNPIVVAHDGAEALGMLFSAGGHFEHELPRLVLLDLNLPKIGGLEVLTSIRGDARTRCLPVVILTSSAEERDIERGYELGANSYVVKPVDFVRFSEVVRQLGSYWLSLNERDPTAKRGGQ